MYVIIYLYILQFIRLVKLIEKGCYSLACTFYSVIHIFFNKSRNTVNSLIIP